MKVWKGILAVVLAAAMAVGGYTLGSKMEQKNITAAIPKQSLETDAPPAPQTVQIEKTDAGVTRETWSKLDESAFSAEGINGTVTLSTSAQTYEGEIMWDDGQQWALEVSDANGGYYTLVDEYINNGSVYFEILETADGSRVINAYIISGAGVTLRQYSYANGVFTQTRLYDSGAVNKLYSSVPMYQ